MGARNPDGTIPLRNATAREIEEVAKQFFWFLMRRDITGFNPRVFPSCDVREQQMEVHTPPVQDFLSKWEAGSLRESDKYPECGKFSNEDDWNNACQKIWYAHQLLRLFVDYLDIMGDRHAQRNARHLSSQLQKYPAYVKVYPDTTRKAGGKRFILKGHRDFR